MVAIPPHGDLHGNQFVGMTVVYDPFPVANSTDGDWTNSRKQTYYFMHRIKGDYEDTLYAQVTLTTTSEL